VEKVWFSLFLRSSTLAPGMAAPCASVAVPSRRLVAIVKLAGSIGGRLEGVYYAFGDVDVFVLFDAPDAGAPLP
jgi:uncharacterized protein with GYD domain